MMVFWWSGPESPMKSLYAARLEDGPHQSVQSLPMTDVQLVVLLQEEAKEISWKTASLLGFPI